MSTFLEVTERIRIPEAELEWMFARSSAPGGQNVNKVNSKAQLRFDVMHSPSIPEDVRARFLAQYPSRLTVEGCVLISAEENRDRLRNMDHAREKLAALLRAVAVPPKRRHATRPTRGSVERRIQEKKHLTVRKKNRSGWPD